MKSGMLVERYQAEDIIKVLFRDTAFDGFSFDMHFTLIFSRQREDFHNGRKLPWIIKVNILSDWWFGSKEEWQDRVRKLTIYELVEPDEPVKAYELACIRWVEGSEVDSASFINDTLLVTFKSGKSIYIPCFVEMGYSWAIDTSDSEWSLTCENNELYAVIPEM